MFLKRSNLFVVFFFLVSILPYSCYATSESKNYIFNMDELNIYKDVLSNFNVFNQSAVSINDDVGITTFTISIFDGTLSTHPGTPNGLENSYLFLKENDGKWGAQNLNGQWTIPCIYEAIVPYYDLSLFSVKYNGKWGFIDILGNIICSPKYTSYSIQDSALILKREDGSQDILDKNGNILFMKIRGYIYNIDLANITILVGPEETSSSDPIELISNIVTPIPVPYNIVGPLNEGMCIVGNDIGQFGAIDCNGDLRVPLIYHDLSKFNEKGLSFGHLGQDPVLVNQSGFVIANLPSHITNIMLSNSNEGLVQYESNSYKYGYLDSTTWTEIIQAQFDTTTPFSNGLAQVSLDSGCGVINTAGQFVVEPIYDSLIGWDAPDANYCWGFKDENVYVCSLNRNDMISPSTCRISIGENDFQIGSYLLVDSLGGGTNYVKLRDLASILNNTNAKFNVEWTNSDGITITQGQSYKKVGGELIPKGEGLKAFSYNDGYLTINGEEITIQGITILGNNYFKIRDLAKILDLEIDYIAETDTVVFPSCQ